jgi:hypothetical protein
MHKDTASEWPKVGNRTTFNLVSNPFINKAMFFFMYFGDFRKNVKFKLMVIINVILD